MFSQTDTGLSNRLPAMRHFPSVFPLAALLVLFAASGCSLFGSGSGGDGIEVMRIPVTDAELIETSGRVVRFSVTSQWRNTCGEFSRFESSRDGMSYSITMYGEQPVGVVCGDAIIDITGEWSTTVPTEGTYTFAFQRGSEEPLERTVVVGGE